MEVRDSICRFGTFRFQGSVEMQLAGCIRCSNRLSRFAVRMIEQSMS